MRCQAPLRNAIDYGQVRFTGAAAFHENGSAYRVMQPGAPQYVGTPSAEIDDAWKALITGASTSDSAYNYEPF